MGRKADFVQNDIYSTHLNGGRKNNPARNNQATIENMYIRLISELCMNRFKWVGLPDSIDARFLELTLFRRALSVFYYDKDFNRYLAMGASGAGRVNMYDNPTSFRVTGPGINKQLSGKDCVPIFANFMRIPDWDIVMTYARKMADIDRTIEITVENMRQTKVIVVDENQRHSWIQIMDQVKTGAPYILGAPGLNPEAVTSFDLNIHHETLPNLMVARSRMWNDCMTMLGVNNANQEKKERLVSGEVEANDEQISATRNIALTARKQAAAQINQKYKLTISVDFNTGTDANTRATGEF